MAPRIKHNRYSNPTDLTDIITQSINPPPISDISIARLIDDCLTTLYREIKSLLVLSSKGKLDPNNARDLRDHLKLLFELKERESESLRGLTDEQLKEKVDFVLGTDSDNK